MIKIDNYSLNIDIEQFLYTLRDLSSKDYIKDIKRKSSSGYIMFTCPFHGEHSEKHPSCGIISDKDSEKEGVFHCFTCGEKGNIVKLTSSVLNITYKEAKEFLIDKYGEILDNSEINFPEWNSDNTIHTKNYFLDESILDNFKYYHPYIESRKISFDVVKKFLVGFNKEKNTITFPVWDDKNNLVMITERSIYSKNFYIQEGIEKPVYLLNFILKENISTVAVCESQINCLYCWTLGVPAVALFGTGSKNQYDILKRSGIRNYILLFDGDAAGLSGSIRFIKNMPKDTFIQTITLPQGKDVNDLSREEFYSLLNSNGILVNNKKDL